MDINNREKVKQILSAIDNDSNSIKSKQLLDDLDIISDTSD